MTATMESTKIVSSGPAQLQFCSNCTRLVNTFNSAPLSGQMTFTENLKSSIGSYGKALEGSTPLEVLALVCGLDISAELLGPICTRCQSVILDMLTAFIIFTQGVTLHSAEFFRNLRARSQPLIQKVKERRIVNEQIAAALAEVTQNEPEVTTTAASETAEAESVPTVDELKTKAAARALRRKFNGNKKRKLRKQKRAGAAAAKRTRLELLTSRKEAVIKLHRVSIVPPVTNPTLATAALPADDSIQNSTSDPEIQCESDGEDNTMAPASESDANDSPAVNYDESFDPPVQVKMECGNSEGDEDKNDDQSNANEDDDSDASIPPSTRSSRSIKKQHKIESEEEDEESEPDYRPRRPVRLKKPRRIIVKHPLPEETSAPRKIMPRRYTCLQPECGKQFVFTKKFARHLKEFHDILTPHICTLCDSVFTQKPHLTEHMKSHEGDSGLIMCRTPGCTAVFSKQAYLKSHMATVHADPEFQCSECGKAFRQSLSLKKHTLLMHSKEELERPYVCEECGRSFVLEEYLRNHMKSHNTERPYSCTLCDKTFKNTKGLKSHRVAHRDDKPFSCKTCARTFKTLGSLRTHTLSHTNRREFACSFPSCARTFNRKVHLIQHFLAVHKLQKAEADQLAKNPVSRQQQAVPLPSPANTQTAMNLSYTKTHTLELNSDRRPPDSGEMTVAIQNIPEFTGFNTNYFTQW